MSTKRAVLVGAVAALLLHPAPPGAAQGLPDVPAIDRDVALIRANRFTYPHIPPLRTTADGRVGISPKPADGMVRFYVMVPEGIPSPFIDSPAGDRILAGSTPFEVPESEFLHGDGDPFRRHYALCDVAAEFPSLGELTNPYACGLNRRDDCYDFVVITSTSLGRGTKKRQLWGTPVTVRVTSPKTPAAAIAQVTTAAPRAGSVIEADVLFEVMTTNDGRLLTGRIATNNFDWVVPGTSDERRHYADLVYSFNGEGRPCDVSGWSDFYPISHAPYDAAVNSRYGFAMYPFRDSTGKTLPDGDDLGITYPWVDRNGRNVFFTSVGATLSLDGRLPPREDSRTRYPARCLPDRGCSSRIESFDNTRGQGVAGLWTRGKMVLLDGILNNTDYGLPLDDAGHRLVELYRDGSGPKGRETGEVRVGTGRDTSASGPPTFVRNTTIVDSLENLFFMLPQMRPVAPRDVAWIVNSGKASDEVAFDGWLDLDALIVSEMVGATSYEGTVPGRGTMHYYDGWRDGAFRDPVRIQNAATVLPERWRVPAAGVAYGNVRLEPVALGGIRGKGLWLDGESGIEYDIPEQNGGTEGTPWYLGVFLDSRFADDDRERTLIGLPDGARILLRGRSALLYSRADGTTAHEVDFTKPLPYGSWTHLGLQVLPNGGGVTFYLDGFAFDFAPGDSDPELRLSPGNLFVGDDPREPAGGVRGWIDELVVIARELGPELACNQAAGTLAGISDAGGPIPTSSTGWVETARRYPPWAHDRIQAELADRAQVPAARYVCLHDYRRPHAGDPANVPSQLRSVRGELVFPEGPLAYGRPRPDSSANSFCLSCHSPEGRGGLTTEALVQRLDLSMEDDPRRQPSQPLRRVFGNVPAGWLGDGRPQSHLEAPPGGLEIDALLKGVVEPVESLAPGLEPCAGDCDTNRSVTIDELTVSVGIALGKTPFALCREAFDCGPSANCIGVAELTRALANALDGCPPSPGSR